MQTEYLWLFFFTKFSIFGCVWDVATWNWLSCLSSLSWVIHLQNDQQMCMLLGRLVIHRTWSQWTGNLSVNAVYRSQRVEHVKIYSSGAYEHCMSTFSIWKSSGKDLVLMPSGTENKLIVSLCLCITWKWELK